MTAIAPGKARRRTVRLPFWLQSPQREKRTLVRPTWREPRWWVGVAWLVVSVLLLGLVGHAALFGILQHARSQAARYEELRTLLAKAESPLGQLDVNERVVAAGTPVGLLEIPRIGVREVILQGTASDQLREGPGHRRDSVMPGQAGTSIVYGRQATYGGPFARLSALVQGDEIKVTTGQGTFTFEVLGLRRAGDPLPTALGEDDGRLQLATADGPPLAPTGVLYLDADLTGEPADTPAAVFGSAVLADGERPMESDLTDLLPLVFTFQWLAFAAILTRWLTQVWGRRQTWIVTAPVLLVLGAATADAAISLLPNLI